MVRRACRACELGVHADCYSLSPVTAARGMATCAHSYGRIMAFAYTCTGLEVCDNRRSQLLQQAFLRCAEALGK